MNRKNRTMALAAFAVAGLFLVSGTSGIGYTGNFLGDTELIAGQHMDVGIVEVSESGDYLYVLFTIEEDDWYLMETHVDITTDGSFPLTKSKNPKVGQFEYSDDHGLVPEYEYAIEKSDVPGWENGFDVAAHAVVVEFGDTSSFPSYVDSYSQGLKKNGAAVDEERSDPDQVLTLGSVSPDVDFFSLGFGGWIIVGFDCPIWNLDGTDVFVWEETWGTTYPLETADVYVSQDGSDWVELGEADNHLHSNNQLTLTEFDLEDVQLDWAKYVMIVDTTDPSIHSATADGYDVNAVEAVHGCIISKETAWGEGTTFEGSNWAMHFEVPASS